MSTTLFFHNERTLTIIGHVKNSPPELIIVSGFALARVRKEKQGNVARRNLGKAAFLVTLLNTDFLSHSDHSTQNTECMKQSETHDLCNVPGVLASESDVREEMKEV